MNEDNIEFYVNKFCIIESEEEADISYIPAIMRRRLSGVDKCALAALNVVYTEDVENLVFSSKKGEVERLIKIINQYTEDGEVSPNTFSGSVHNYSAGFFLLNKKKSIPYTAISASENSISAGIVASVISGCDNIIFCYADYNDGNQRALGLSINKKYGDNKYRMVMQNSVKSDDFLEFSNLFKGIHNSLETGLFKIEKI